MPSVACSSLTIELACMKCSGVRSTCESSPGSPELGQIRCTVRRASAASVDQQTFIPPCAGLSLAPPARNFFTASPSGMVEM